MPFSSQVRLACYLYYDVVNPVTYEKLNWSNPLFLLHQNAERS
jgi:hypothetical protein